MLKRTNKHHSRNLFLLLGMLIATLVTLAYPGGSFAACSVVPGCENCAYICDTQGEASGVAESVAEYLNSLYLCGKFISETHMNQSPGAENGFIGFCNYGTAIDCVGGHCTCTTRSDGCVFSACAVSFDHASECANDPCCNTPDDTCCGSKDPCCGKPNCKGGNPPGGPPGSGPPGVGGGPPCPSGQCCP